MKPLVKKAVRSKRSDIASSFCFIKTIALELNSINVFNM